MCREIVKAANTVAFAVRHTIHVLHRQLHVLFGILHFAHVYVRRGHAAVSAGEVRVQSYSTGKGPQGFLHIPRVQLFYPDPILVHGLQRRGRKRSASLLDLNRFRHGVTQRYADGAGELWNSEQNLVFKSIVKPAHERFDSLRLIPFGLVG